MAETTATVLVAAPHRADDRPRPAQPVAAYRADRTRHRQHRALLLVWQFLPYFVPMKAGTKLFFTVPSQSSARYGRCS